MARVCVVVEYCDDHDDGCASYQQNRAVTGNPTIAENLIEGYKQDLIKRTYAEGGIATEATTVGGYVTVVTEHHEGMITYKYTYQWTIEQYEIVES